MVDGIYAVYLSGIAGSGMILIALKDGIIAGADTSGNLVDGEYKVDEGLYKLRGTLGFLLKHGSSSILGISAPENDITLDVPFSLTLPIEAKPFHRISTTAGPLNASFKKLREL